ncbi:MAG: sensor histidine kinase, partial [Candidatus Binatia bacterium]
LLSNAIKFSAPGSEIGAEVVDEGDAVEIAVWDRGIGLSATDLERIFRPFEQVENANRTSQKGTGLGLAICKRFVELHGGTIRAESEEGRGSRFVVRLPKARPEAAPSRFAGV